MNQDNCVDVSDNISLKKKEDDPSETVQNRTARHEMFNDSTWETTTPSESLHESETNFKHTEPNISMKEGSKLEINKHVLQQESVNDSIWPSTTPEAKNAETHINLDESISTAEYPVMVVRKNTSKTDEESSNKTEGTREIRDLGTSEKNDLNISKNDNTDINLTENLEKEKTDENVIQKVEDVLENTKVEVNVENVQDDKKTTEEIIHKFVKCEKVLERDNHFYKRNEGEAELSNVSSLADQDGRHTNHHLPHKTRLSAACHDGHFASHQLSRVTIGTSGKVNYTIFPNSALQSHQILHKGTTEDQLLKYLEDELHESMTKECPSPFKEDQEQEVNLDDFVEISLEVKL